MFVEPRLSLKPRDLGLILSYHCQSRCAHCLYNCHPGWDDWMAPDAVEQVLQKTRDVWGKTFRVHLTGGEPMLNFPLTLEAAYIARKLEIPTYLETNAGWCRDPNMAEKRFHQLREAGVSTILLSVSPFHQAAIPLKRTLTGISAARAVFGVDRVIIYQAEWLVEMSRFSHQKPIPLSRYDEIYGEAEAAVHLWQGFGLISGGRAGVTLGEKLNKHPVSDFEGLRCQSELAYAGHSHLDLYGNFVPAFCGGISLGDWHDLDQVVADFRAGEVSTMIATLLEAGPFGLYRQAAGMVGFEADPAGYAGKCHLCVDVRRALVETGRFPENLQPVKFYESF
jgi:hypothetical protein